jgi:signal transduction histidine kinase
MARFEGQYYGHHYSPRSPMDQIAKERDRLLQRTARAYGLSFATVSLVCLSIPGAVDLVSYLIVVPLYLVLGLAYVRIGQSRSIVWVLLAIISGSAILAVIVLLNRDTATPAAGSAITQLSSFAIAGVAIVLATSRRRAVLLGVTFLVIGLFSILETEPWRATLHTAGLYLVGWTMTTVLGVWIAAAVPQAARRIASIGRAHRTERHASEMEAQRRQSARLLHDTVLATLTLLAHSGVGVAPDAMRQQAADDARLLRQLRLGASPAPEKSGDYKLEPVEETVLGTTLESVKQRFGRMGLEVNWHGTGQVLLPSDVLDAFLLALAECLENVRRHSGVTEAHVTIVDDEQMVRAMITDAGVGFTLDDVDSARLGFKESVVGRLKEVGGHARLFSSPGAGTTVVLEVPR